MVATVAPISTTGPTGVNAATPRTPTAPRDATVLAVSTVLNTLAFRPSVGDGTTVSFTANACSPCKLFMHMIVSKIK